MTDDLDALRAKLAGRKDDCWERLEDAASELIAVHEADAEELVARVRAVAERERLEAHQLRCLPPER